MDIPPLELCARELVYIPYYIHRELVGLKYCGVPGLVDREVLDVGLVELLHEDAHHDPALI